MGSSPVPGTHDATRQQATEHAKIPSSPVGFARSTATLSTPRTEANEPGVIGSPSHCPEYYTPATGDVAPTPLPADRAEIRDALPDLPEAIIAAMLGLVRASKK